MSLLYTVGLFFQWLANFSEKTPSSEADSSSASQEILLILWKPKDSVPRSKDSSLLLHPKPD